MNILDSLSESLEGFSDEQREVIAEMVAQDCVLMSVWKEEVMKCVRENGWQPAVLLNSINDSVAGIVADIVCCETETGDGSLQ